MSELKSYRSGLTGKLIDIAREGENRATARKVFVGAISRHLEQTPALAKMVPNALGVVQAGWESRQAASIAQHRPVVQHKTNLQFKR
jgi:hypothetical protein